MWGEEPLSRRRLHAASDAKRRANIAQLHQALVRIVGERTGARSLTTQQALEEALALLQCSEAAVAAAAPSSRPPPPPPSLPVHFSSQQHPDGGGLLSDADGGFEYGTERLLPVSGLHLPVPRPIVCSNTHLRQLSTLMEYAIRRYCSGAAFHPGLPSFRSSPALHSFLAGGGRCGVLSADLVILDCSHDLTPHTPARDQFQRRPGSECRLRVSDSESEPPLTYDDLARILCPVVRAMDEEYVQGTVQSSQCVLLAAAFPRLGRMIRSLKLMTLVRPADGREPVLIAVEFVGTFSSSIIS